MILFWLLRKMFLCFPFVISWMSLTVLSSSHNHFCLYQQIIFVQCHSFISTTFAIQVKEIYVRIFDSDHLEECTYLCLLFYFSPIIFIDFIDAYINADFCKSFFKSLSCLSMNLSIFYKENVSNDIDTYNVSSDILELQFHLISKTILSVMTDMNIINWNDFIDFYCTLYITLRNSLYTRLAIIL